MIKNIYNKKIKVTLKPVPIVLPEDIQQKIEAHWEKIKQENPTLWNGEIVCVTDYFETEQELIIVCQKSNYAHYLYDERIGLPDQYKCYNLFADGLLETQDGYYVIGELEENMSYPFCLQLPGENVDNQDIVGEKIDILHTIQREVQEELNIDVTDQEQVLESELKYFMHTLGKGNGYGVVRKTKLKKTAEQMKEHYCNYLTYLKENNLEVEFGKIHLLKKQEALAKLEKLPNPRRGYLKLLIQEDTRII